MGNGLVSAAGSLASVSSWPLGTAVARIGVVTSGWVMAKKCRGNPVGMEGQ